MNFNKTIVMISNDKTRNIFKNEMRKEIISNFSNIISCTRKASVEAGMRRNAICYKTKSLY